MMINNEVLCSGDVIAGWGEIIGHFWPVAVISFGMSLIATPVCRHIALKKGIVDKPDDFLKPHEQPIPYLGGVAIFLGWIAGILVSMCSEGIHIQNIRMAGIGLSGLAIMLVGLFDDLHFMRPVVKLTANIMVAIFLVILGIGDELIRVVPGVSQANFGPEDHWLLSVYSIPLMIFIVVGACNATNLIDGLDGLCTGVLGIISIGFFIIACHMRLYEEVPVADERIILALAMLGAAAGFLPFNLNPAKVFLGDAGSMLLGLNAAVIILLFGEKNLTRWMIGALVVFGLPIADMLLTLARRWRNGRPLMEGDRSHFYDQLRDRGFSVKQVVAICYVLTIAFVAIGASVIFLRTRYAITIYFIVVVLVIAGIWKFNMVGIEESRPPAPSSDSAGEMDD